MLPLSILFFVFLIGLNVYIAIKYKKIFCIGFIYSTHKDMTVFQLQQEYSKQFSLGFWRKKGESGFLVYLIFNIVLFLFLLLLYVYQNL